MSDMHKIVRIFIGSPGGLEDERQAVHDVVNDINNSNSEHWGLHLKLLGWEEAIPGYHRPQSKINEDLDKCDYFLGVLWNRWGSPTSTDKDGYTSGFEEEFNRTRQNIDNGLMKDMAIYFKKIKVPPGMVPDEDAQKVFDFREKCIVEKKFFFKDFENLSDFQNFIQSKLMDIGWKETDLVQSVEQVKIQATHSPQFLENPEKSGTQESWLINEEAREFLSEISQRPPDWEKTEPYEIARFRLIASALSRPGNDDSYLGNHDANMIFQHLRDNSLAKQEILSLIDNGVVGFQHQNIPLWRWIARAAQNGDYFGHIRFLASVGAGKEKTNAIILLGLASQPIPSIDELVNKQQVLTFWLSDEADHQTFDAALSFLSSNADNGDISLLEEVVAEYSMEIRTKVEAAIIGILSRKSVSMALKRLVEKEVYKVEDALVEELFRSPQSLTTETMALCLSAKSDDVRLRAVQILFERNEVTLEAAKTLLTDSNHEIRLFAAESLKKMGEELDNDIVKKALTLEIQASRLGFGMLQRKEMDETYHERYLSNRLAELDFKVLKAKVEEAGVFHDRELSVLYSKYSSKLQNDIRKNIEDCFKGYFQAVVQKEVESGWADPNMVSKIKKIETFYRKNLCTLALNALCSLEKTQDLNIVRKTVDEIEVDATASILKYLARFGDWSDIERVKKLGDYTNERTGLLGFQKTKLPDHKAATIFALGKARIADMLELDLDRTIRKSLTKQLPKKTFVNLSDDILMRELNRDDDEYRVVFALLCVRSLSKQRIISLLNQYVDSNDHRYYNTVHWLDLGASLPRRLVKTIVERKLLLH